ncbi:MAG: glycosyltransferase [Acidobacteriota bacterium]|nr:glycosyltransferase [Acidobacteriota bacterium]MDQ3918351.1 glycosyltransferase [Acidobacteriota bacterium]
MRACKLAVIVSGFPRRSETFALNELLALEERGALACVFATKPGETCAPQPGCERLLDRVQLLPQVGPIEQAAIVAERLEGLNLRGIHGYFAHTPAEVAAHAAARLRLPYGFSVHARDARKVAPDDLARRAQRAACVIACNMDVAKSLRGAGAQVELVPHGVDLKRFRPQSKPEADTLRVLAVGRLVEKKGFHHLLAAAARVRSPFSLRIIGEGPERERLSRMIEAYGLDESITLCGARNHEELPEEYARAHVLVAPSIQDHMGDRDGLPNVVLEAMASGCAVLASDMGAISSAIVQGQTGILVPPGDEQAMASGLELLALKPDLREELGRNARSLVERDYEVERCTERLYQLLEKVYA